LAAGRNVLRAWWSGRKRKIEPGGKGGEGDRRIAGTPTAYLAEVFNLGTLEPIPDGTLQERLFHTRL
jgi:hypothetical protein